MSYNFEEKYGGHQMFVSKFYRMIRGGRSLMLTCVWASHR